MQAVILAAGKSTRTYPLTLTRPKPLLKIANKAILDYNLEALGNLADEIIILVGYKQKMIKKFTSQRYPNLNIIYVEQKEQLGTGHALLVLKDYIKGRFILLLGDNIYSKADMKSISKHKYSILVKQVQNWGNFGVIVEKNGIVTDIIEKPEKFISDIINCGLFSFDEKIFRFLKKTKKSERGEYELTDALKMLAEEKTLKCVKSSLCPQISYSWDLLAADSELRKNKTLIGPNSKITGTIKNSTIGNNCVIAGDVTNSIIMDNTVIEKGSIVEDSIIGENVHFKGKIIAKNNVCSRVKDAKIKVGRLGAVIGDNVNAKNVIINAGCKIWPSKKIKNRTIESDIL